MNIYFVDFLANGICYRTVSNCSWKEVQELKAQAKRLGEEVRIEKYDQIKIEY